jgi:hypothetical protein
MEKKIATALGSEFNNHILFGTEQASTPRRASKGEHPGNHVITTQKDPLSTYV